MDSNALTLEFNNPNPNRDLTGGHPDDKLIVFLTYYIAKLI